MDSYGPSTCSTRPTSTTGSTSRSCIKTSKAVGTFAASLRSVRLYASISAKCFLSAVLELDPSYDAVHNPLMAVTFARILPYAAGADADFTLERVRHYLSRSSTVPIAGGI